MSERVMVPVRSMADLRTGDIVRHRGTGHGYVVHENYGSYVIAARTAHICNPNEWLVLRDAAQSSPSQPAETPILGSDAKCEECGAYYPYHTRRKCPGEHVAPVEPAETPERKVGCERLDGLLNIHPESETCDVCAAETPEERKDA